MTPSTMQRYSLLEPRDAHAAEQVQDAQHDAAIEAVSLDELINADSSLFDERFLGVWAYA